MRNLVFIMCAGRGSRYDSNVPKSLVEFDFTNGRQTVVENIIWQLNTLNIDDLVIHVVCRRREVKLFDDVLSKLNVKIIPVDEDYITGTASTLLVALSDYKTEAITRNTVTVIWGDAVLIPFSAYEFVFSEKATVESEVLIPLRKVVNPYTNFILSELTCTYIDQTKFTSNVYDHGLQDFSIFKFLNLKISDLIDFCEPKTSYYRLEEIDLLQFINYLISAGEIYTNVKIIEHNYTSVGFNTKLKAMQLNRELRKYQDIEDK